MALAAWLPNVGNQTPGDPVKDGGSGEDHQVWLLYLEQCDSSVLMLEDCGHSSV